MNNSIVLGYPYDRAMYWLLAAERRDYRVDQTYTGNHSYYKTLYGKTNNTLINETISLSILFDKIYLVAADTYYPNHEKYYNLEKSSYTNSELGLFSDWSWYGDRSELKEQVDMVLEDKVINNYLSKIPPAQRSQLIERTIAQLRIAKKYKANIMGSNRYLSMAKKIQSIIYDKDNSDYRLQKKQKLLTSFDWAFNTKTLTFKIDNLEEFIAIRREKELRNYAESFRKHALSSSNKKDLVKAMLSVRHTFTVGKNISGIMSVGASIFGVIPIPPPYNIPISIGIDIGNRIVNHYTKKNEWYSFAPKVYQTLDIVRLEKEAKNS